jgi:hypothetical protein
VFQTSEGLSGRASLNVGTGGYNSRGRRTLSTSASEHNGRAHQGAKHEAVAAVRLVNRDGDVLWSATKEGMGAKFRGAP